MASAISHHVSSSSSDEASSAAGFGLYKENSKKFLQNQPILASVSLDCIKLDTKRAMDDDGAELVTYLAYKLKLKPYALICIEVAKAGGGKQHEGFLRYLVHPNSNVSIHDVTAALDQLEMNEAKEVWDCISYGKSRIPEIELCEVQRMNAYLVLDPRNRAIKSWIDLADKLGMSTKTVDCFQQVQQTCGQYSPANELFKHLKMAAINVRQLVDALIEIDEDQYMPSCMNVLNKVENDVREKVRRLPQELQGKKDIRMKGEDQRSKMGPNELRLSGIGDLAETPCIPCQIDRADQEVMVDDTHLQKEENSAVSAVAQKRKQENIFEKTLYIYFSLHVVRESYWFGIFPTKKYRLTDKDSNLNAPLHIRIVKAIREVFNGQVEKHCPELKNELHIRVHPSVLIERGNYLSFSLSVKHSTDIAIPEKYQYYDTPESLELWQKIEAVIKKAATFETFDTSIDLKDWLVSSIIMVVNITKNVDCLWEEEEVKTFLERATHGMQQLQLDPPLQFASISLDNFMKFQIDISSPYEHVIGAVKSFARTFEKKLIHRTVNGDPNFKSSTLVTEEEKTQTRITSLPFMHEYEESPMPTTWEEHPFKHCISTLSSNGKDFQYFDLTKLNDPRYERLPYSIRVLLESVVRNCDGFQIHEKDVKSVLNWDEIQQQNQSVEFPFLPARIIFQDFTGVPALVDFAAMRDAVARLGGDPSRINPLTPADLVIDHSVQVDYFKSADAAEKETANEFERNKERFQFLKWGSGAFENLQIIPPGSGIGHPVNLEYLAHSVFNKEGMLYPDSLVGTDSHTTVINGLGIVGWGVGGIEAEAVLLGQAISMLVPKVVGYKITGELSEIATSTDVVLAITKHLRDVGVVGKFVEFFGPGVALLSIADRATISNMCPDYGATVAFFPFDEMSIKYFQQLGHDNTKIKYIEKYLKANKMFRDYTDLDQDPTFSQVVELDLGTVVPSCRGPKRAQDRVLVSDLQEDFGTCLNQKVGFKGFGLSPEKLSASVPFVYEGVEYTLNHGSVVLASITSCTNTSNPSVMLGAGLLAKNAVEAGITMKPYINTSVSPGSWLVSFYLKESGVEPYFEQLGFHNRGYGCMTCTGSSDPLPDEVEKAIEKGELVAVGILSGNRNFEGRVHPLTRANYLASPLLVIAYALAGRIDINFETEPLGHKEDGSPIFLRDIWPKRSAIHKIELKTVIPAIFKEVYSKVKTGNTAWDDLKTSSSSLYPWDLKSTYIKSPPFFDEMTMELPDMKSITDASVLLNLGDSVTTDHISPSGMIARNSPAARYLGSLGLTPRDFNSYGSRRGNDAIMSRGTFANIRLVNKFMNKPGPKGLGPKTKHWPSGDEMDIFEAASRYREEKRSLIILAGKEYGSGSSRDWAAKGPWMLGIKAVIAESYGRIHRRDLVSMGIAPLQYLEGESTSSLNLTGMEKFDIVIPKQLTPGELLTVNVNDSRSFRVKARFDTPLELQYFRNGGILNYMIRKVAT